MNKGMKETESKEIYINPKVNITTFFSHYHKKTNAPDDLLTQPRGSTKHRESQSNSHNETTTTSDSFVPEVSSDPSSTYESEKTVRKD